MVIFITCQLIPGKQASKDERSGAMKNALDFIKDHKYHPSTKVQVRICLHITMYVF